MALINQRINSNNLKIRMISVFKSLFGIGETETFRNTTKELAALSEEERQKRAAEGKEQLIKEYKLKGRSYEMANGLVGLENLGNTCFMGSALQCLSEAQPLTSYFLKGGWEDQLNTLSSPTKGRLACEYFMLLKRLWAEKEESVSPGNVKKAIQKANKTFAGYAQQDSQEFLSYFLDALHEDLNQVVIKPYEMLNDFSNQPIATFAKEQFDTHLKRNSSFIVDNFHGQFYSHIQCPECTYESVTCDPFDILSLGIPSKEKRSVEGYIVPFTYAEPIKNFSFYCNDCEELPTVLNHIFATLPNVNSMNYRPMFYLRSKIVEQLPPGFKISVASAMDNQGLLFICQIMDPESSKLVFGDRAEAITANADSKNAYHLRIFVNEGVQQAGIEREVLVPENATIEDLYVLIYLIHRAAFIAAGIAEPTPALLDEVPVTRELLLKEMECFWPEGKTDGTLSLFTVSVNKKEVHQLDSTENIFQQGSDKVLRIDVNLNAKRLIGPLKLKRCLKLDVEPLLPTSERELTLFDCLESFTQEERLDIDNMWYCSRCKAHKQAFKKMALHRLPKILIIHMKRFKKEIVKSEWVHYKKNGNKVGFPLAGLDLSRFTIDNDEKCVYDLFAVSNHFGSCGGGHYTAYCKNPVKGGWYVFDDESVRPIDEGRVVSDAAYVLFYQKRL